MVFWEVDVHKRPRRDGLQHLKYIYQSCPLLLLTAEEGIEEDKTSDDNEEAPYGDINESQSQNLKVESLHASQWITFQEKEWWTVNIMLA